MAFMNLSSHFHKAVLMICFIMATTMTFAQSSDQILDKEVSISFDGLSTEESLAKLEDQVGIYTAYNKKELKNEKITFTFKKELLSEILDVILASENLSYKLIGNTVTIFRSDKGRPAKLEKKVKMQKHTINGYVVDGSSKETLIGANVYVNGLNIGVNTNEYGFYSVTIPEGEYELRYSYIGYETSVQQVALKEDVVLFTISLICLAF